MDWSKSKSIFIVVFLILDVFLYSLYLNRHTEAQQVQEESIGEKNIEVRLKEDNITYEILPTNTGKAAYISGKVKSFEEEDLDIENAENYRIDKNKLVVTLKEPYEIKNLDEASSYNDFLNLNVYNGASYTLWQIDKENRSATFFQKANSRTLYYIKNGLVTVYWNDRNEIIRYEQTLLENLEAYEEEKVLTSPLNAIQAVYNKGLLAPNSKITKVDLGYSTLVQITEMQVFVPTWEIRVQTEDEEKEYFVNAVEGGVLNLTLDTAVEEDEEDSLTTDDEIDLETELEKSRE
ncbi:two-component system regulatory protein YycI [Ureibacillus aquaedulcis]|uniref:Two-component system regulatory protein YycI n=1 Tax=Ureibacillus aquaedulcis TaxID=3058421 RepID=A0ABT8GT71_9BACL|nr:two-component system regulatory protein YycI [Ureibacillus sp. BA0131]MDN4494126.1 two-component system regulatory protein YycI [Ureibacillus sp. BA0131]